MPVIYFNVQYSVDGEMREERISGLNKYQVAAELGSKFFKERELYIFSIQMA